MTATIDALDRKLITLLDTNSRVSLSTLARQCKRGRDTIEYRIGRLEKLGIIRGYRAILDHGKLGLTLYKCYLRYSASSTERKKFTRRLEKQPRVLWFAEASGEWDLIVAIAAGSAHEYSRIERNVLAPIDDLITDMDVYTVTSFTYSPIRFQQSDRGSNYLVGEEFSGTIEALDGRILEMLSRNARATLTEIAQELNVSVGLVRRHIENLEEQRYIAGYHLELDFERLGLNLYKTQLYLSPYSEEVVRNLKVWADSCPNLYSFIHQIGKCRIEMEFRIPAYSSYVEILGDLRNQFSANLRDTKTILLHSAHLTWSILEESRLVSTPA